MSVGVRDATAARDGCAILSTGMARPARKDTPPGELIYEAVSDALLGTPFGIDEVEYVVDAGSDIVDGRSISSVSLIEYLGAHRKDEWRVEEDGIFAAQFAEVLMESGAGRLALVIGYGNNTELSMSQYWNLVTIPFLERPLGLDDRSASDLQRQVYLRKFGLDQARLDALGAHPSGTSGDTQPPPAEGATPVDGAVALLLGDASLAGRPAVPALAWIRGTGQATDPHVLAERDLWESPSARKAWQTTIDSAGSHVDADDLGRIELSATRRHELPILVEAMGLAPPGEGCGYLGSDVGARVNPTGASLRSSVVPANGLLRLAAAANALADGSTDHRYAVAHGSGGLALQKNGFMLLERVGGSS